MNKLITLFIFSNLVMAVAATYYFLSLKKDISLGFRRGFMLSLLPVSVILTLLGLNLTFPVDTGLAVIKLPQIEVGQLSTLSSGLFHPPLFVVGYMAVFLVLLISFLFKTGYLFWSFRKDQYQKIKDSKIIESEKYEASFSFFNFVVLDQRLSKNNKEAVLLHELGHVRHFHSLDILYYEFLKALCWINPIVWILRRELKEIHELQADSYAVGRGLDKAGYMELILTQNTGGSFFRPASYFNQKLIKKRFVMISKEVKTKKWSIRIWMLLPLFVMMLYMISCSAMAGNSSIKSTTEEDTAFVSIDKQAEFPGGMPALAEFIMKNVKYPEKAKEKGIEGTVIIEFLVDKDGTPKNFKLVRSVSKELDSEALRVLELMPKWKPAMSGDKAVKVKMALPIKFKLEKKDSQ